MGQIHDLIETSGKKGALAATDEPRDVLETAARYMSDEDHVVGFAYSGWAQCALPHRRHPAGEVWEVTNGPTTLLVEPGHIITDKGAVATSVPFGVYARLIMLFLQTEAIRTQCRTIELGGSWRAWLERMGISYGGKTGKRVKEQAELLSRCRLSFHIQDGNRMGMVNQSIVEGALFLQEPTGNERQSRLSLEVAVLSQPFFDQLVKHGFPIDEAAIRGLTNNSSAMDAYLWLAYRLHALNAPKRVSWAALWSQHGRGYKELRQFKAKFKPVLKLALAVYREANVEVDEDGIILKPSKSPVPTQVISLHSRRTASTKK
ncbi:replication protein RepA [Roseomonas chloroacetimidivorans]|uniref:replication protein RepA n=1 Tax=Roseomonas chloroacetimidivorans TaxID=1766656 RepID=UPI003C74BADA